MAENRRGLCDSDMLGASKRCLHRARRRHDRLDEEGGWVFPMSVSDRAGNGVEIDRRQTETGGQPRVRGHCRLPSSSRALFSAAPAVISCFLSAV